MTGYGATVTVTDALKSTRVTPETFRTVEIGDRVLVSTWVKGDREYARSEVVSGVVTETGVDEVVEGPEAWFEVSGKQEFYELDLAKREDRSVQIYKFVPIGEEKD